MYVGNRSCNAKMFLNDHILPVVNEVTDLGVIVDSCLMFIARTEHIIVPALMHANLIHKCFLSRATATLLRAFTVYIRLLLEYTSCVWSLLHTGLIAVTESV
jgi:hypothetical protein